MNWDEKLHKIGRVENLRKIGMKLIFVTIFFQEIIFVRKKDFKDV